MPDSIYTDGRYLQNNPGWGLQDAAYKAGYVVDLLKKNSVHPETVTDIGCGAGGILEFLHLHYAGIRELRGYDISADAIALAKTRENEKMRFFREDILEKNDHHADLVMVIDVFEHVRDFYSMLEKIKPYGRRFIFHIPMDLSCRTLLKPHVLLQQRRAVGHIHYFSKEMVWWMLADTGYRVIDWQYSRPMIDVAPAKGPRQRLKKWLRKCSFSLNKELSVKLWGGYSMMILAE